MCLFVMFQNMFANGSFGTVNLSVVYVNKIAWKSGTIFLSASLIVFAEAWTRKLSAFFQIIIVVSAQQPFKRLM